ncbi:MAG: acetylglutamate kinase [Nanoarchaeota archaeon]|nr:acetylglutamate kinase [Nanoarchaeota archaeon]
MNLIEKTKVLIEALPYIKKYNGSIVVIKFGGNAMSKMRHLVEDIVLLKHIGANAIVVHGGGPEINAELKKAHIKLKFINGLRYTDDVTIKIVEKVFFKINKEIVSNIIKHGAKSMSVNGCIKVKQKSHELGLVGEITKINRQRILKILKAGFVPVISPLGIGSDGKHYNINADTVASHIAIALGAEKLTILTNVEGVIINGKFLSHIDFDTAKQGIKKGTINKGMVPKLEACIYAVKNKCPKAHLINGLVPHSLLLEIFTDRGIGTEVVYKNGHKKNH